MKIKIKTFFFIVTNINYYSSQVNAYKMLIN